MTNYLLVVHKLKHIIKHITYYIIAYYIYSPLPKDGGGNPEADLASATKPHKRDSCATGGFEKPPGGGCFPLCC